MLIISTPKTGERLSYLKKTKMHCLAQQLCEDVSIMKDCKYLFYRGCEWLKWNSDEECEDGWLEWKLYRIGNFLSLEKVQHLESEFKAITVKRECFNLNKILENAT